MGMEYNLWCVDCALQSNPTELSIVGYIQLKHPDEAEDDFVNWIEFLTVHNQHNIRLVDSRGKQTDPRKIRGDYVIGLKDFDSSLTLQEKCKD